MNNVMSKRPNASSVLVTSSPTLRAILERLRQGATLRQVGSELRLSVEQVQAALSAVQNHLRPSATVELHYELMVDAASWVEDDDL